MMTTRNKQQPISPHEYAGGLTSPGQSGWGYDVERAMLDTLPTATEGNRLIGGSDGLYGGLFREDIVNIEALLPRIALNTAKVERNDDAVALLAQLHSNLIQTKRRTRKWRDQCAVAMLAAAQLCDVDESSIRLTDSGARLIDSLRRELAH